MIAPAEQSNVQNKSALTLTETTQAMDLERG
jgi:hypothetical protein